MPAERTRSPKKEKEDIDGIQLTWTDPVESLAAPQQIAFAPAVTPGTYTDDLHVESAESAPSLFPSNPYSSTGPKKPGHGKKKAEDHIPRPPNAFILFRSSFIKSRHVSTEVETNHSTLSKIIGLTWQNMPHEERQFWHSKAKLAQAEHKRKFPDYAFRPSHVKAKAKGGGAGSGGNAIGGAGAGGEQHQQQQQYQKRKVREVGPKDMKRCAKIAQLLVEGKKGDDLKAAVEEFDKNHVPTVVTRFDTPITARSFRRSLSEPAPDTDPSAPAFLRPDPKPSPRRLRATSSQPTMSRPSTPRMDEPAMLLLGGSSFSTASASSSFSSSSSVFGSSPFSNFSDSADVPSDAAATWSDMPPLVYPPVGPVDNSFITKDAPPSLDFNTFVFHDAPATCIESAIDPLTPAPNTTELYGAFHVETPAPCAPAGSLEPQLAIDLSFLDSWSSASPFPSSPCTPISCCYSDGGGRAGPFSPGEVVPAPPHTPAAYDAYNDMVAAQFDSRTGIVGFDCSNLGTALSPEGLASAPLVVAHPHDQQQYSYLAASKGYFSSPDGHKLPIPEMASADVAGFTDAFMQSCQAFTF